MSGAGPDRPAPDVGPRARMEHDPKLPAPVAEPSALAEFERERTTARVSLARERQEALDRQARHAGWFMLFGVGPAALIAVILALVTGRPDLVWPVFGIGIGIQLWRIWQEQRRIRELERELEDPIDGS